MAFSIITRLGDGATNSFSLGFTLGNFDRSLVSCQVGSEVSPRTIEWISDGFVTISGAAPGLGVPVVFRRTLDKTQLTHLYENGDAIEESNLDESNLQLIMIAQEALDGRISGTQDIPMNGNKITSLGAGVLDTDAANVAQVNAAANSVAGFAVSAAMSDASALTSKNASATSETNAHTSEVNAHTSEVNAAISAADTATDKSSAQTFADSAAISANKAAASAAEGLYEGTVDIVAIQSPYTPLLANANYLHRADTTLGDIEFDLSALSVYGQDVNFGFVKISSDTNPVSLVRGGSDTINGGTGYTNSTQYQIFNALGDESEAAWIIDVHTATITDNSITFGKLQQISTDTLVGRDTSGTGDATTISVTGGLEFTGSNSIRRQALTGAITASAGSNTTALSDGIVTTSKIVDASVTPAKLDATATYVIDTLTATSASVSGELDVATLLSAALVQITAGSHINFGATTGDSGYGIRDNSGVIETKNSGGTWSSNGIKSAQLSTPGWIQFANGFIIEWGSIDPLGGPSSTVPGNTRMISLPKEMLTAPWSILFTKFGTQDTWGPGVNPNIPPTTTDFNIFTTQGFSGFYWLAIGMAN